MFRKLFGILRKKLPLKIAFLLGSGVSIPAGMPTTQQITECILSGLDETLGHGVARHHSDGTYYYHYTEETLIGKDEYVPRILILLNRLKAEIDGYYFQSRHSANYEDLYYKFHNWRIRETSRQEVTPEYREERAGQIANALASHDRWKNHGHAISRDVLWNEIQLRIEHPKSELERAAIRLWALFNWIFDKTPILKMIVSKEYRYCRFSAQKEARQ